MLYALLISGLLAPVGLDLLPPALKFLEGDAPEARQLGFQPTHQSIRVVAVEDLRDPSLEIVWEKPVTIPVYQIPKDARVFTREKWTGAPLVAGLLRGGMVVLWTATSPGTKGYERYPYLLHALRDLGVEFPFRGSRTWAFFDSSYRLRADSDFLARSWRSAGIAGLHIAAWHFYDPEPGRDDYLRKLIDACHRQGIVVYAWLELPHVSDAFWEQHPEWREKTAILQDAHLDWRKLMNLTDPDCARAVEAGLQKLLARFDWDGINLAELYFESLYGPSDPLRFTPMNETVRAAFRREAGFDPLQLFGRDSPRQWQRDPASWTRFAGYRAALARSLQERWLEKIQRWRSDLDLVLTHIDDRFDTGMKERLGADAAAVLPLLDRIDFTFAIEDPATIWHLGPERYAEIARRYAPLTPRFERLAVDINIVERYQDVYPTKKQTGTELFQLIHQAGRSFPRVMLYFEQSIARADYELLSAASAAVTRAERSTTALTVEAAYTTGVRWSGPARIDGKLWPAQDGSVVWVPPGKHRIENDAASLPLRFLHVNADLIDARVIAGGAELQYRSSSRAAVLLDRPPARIEIDGRPIETPALQCDQHWVVLLPRGSHAAKILAAERW